MKRLCVVAGLVCFLCGSALAIDFRGVGDWSDPNLWSEGRVPTGEEEVKIRGDETVATLSGSTGDWGVGQRMRVYEDATLLVQDGAALAGAGWLRVGASNPGYVEQSGGLVLLMDGRDSARLGIGDQDGSDGYYTISGGTLTYVPESAGELLVGARAGKGKLTIVGSEPIIEMGELVVGDRAGGDGTIEFQIDANGVSPIVLDESVAIDPEGDESTATLLISAIEAPPAADLVLIDVPEDAEAPAPFDTVNGVAADDGAPVRVIVDGAAYYYHLAYARGGTNDVVLVFDGAVDLVPFSLPATADVELGNDEQTGPDSASNGSGLGARNISARRRVFLLGYDIAGLLGEGEELIDVSFSNFSHDQHDEVTVYGVIEDLDVLDVEALTWNTAPGLQNDPTPELGAVVALDVNDLTDALLTFEGPGEKGVRFSTDTSAALADFLSADEDGIATFLVAPSADGNQLIVRSSEHSAGGPLLEGWIVPPLPAMPISFSDTAPTPGELDIANFVGADTDSNNVGTAAVDGATNDGTTYVAFDRPSQGQTFVTGDNEAGYVLTGIWVQHVGYLSNADATWYMMPAGSLLGVRVTDPAASGTDAFVLSDETYTVTRNEPGVLPAELTNTPTGTGTWIHIDLESPVALAPLTEYGFDLTGVLTSGFGADLFFEWLGIKDDAPGGNPYADGSAYTSGASGVADNTLTVAPGDRVFVVELSLP